MTKDEKIKRLAENLPRLRKLAGWTDVEFARMLGLSRQDVYYLERGDSRLTMAQYIAIRHLFDDWIERHPENKMLSRIIPLLLDDERFVGELYSGLQVITDFGYVQRELDWDGYENNFVNEYIDELDRKAGEKACEIKNWTYEIFEMGILERGVKGNG